MRKIYELSPRGIWILLILAIVLLLGASLVIGNKIKKETPKTNTQASDFKKYLLHEEVKKEFPHGDPVVEEVNLSAHNIDHSDEAQITSDWDGSVEVWRPLVAQYNWPVEEALLVIRLESGGNPSAVSSTNDYGLFQLHNQPIFDPAENVRIAYQMYCDRGWTPWCAVAGILH